MPSGQRARYGAGRGPSPILPGYSYAVRAAQIYDNLSVNAGHRVDYVSAGMAKVAESAQRIGARKIRLAAYIPGGAFNAYMPAGTTYGQIAQSVKTLNDAGMQVTLTGVDRWIPSYLTSPGAVAPFAVENLNEPYSGWVGATAPNVYPGAGTFAGALPANGGTATAGQVYTEPNTDATGSGLGGWVCLQTHTIAAGNRPTSYTFTSSLWRPHWIEACRLYDLELKAARTSAGFSSMKILGPGMGGGATLGASFAALATVLSTDGSGGAHIYPGGGTGGDGPFYIGTSGGSAIADVSSRIGDAYLSELNRSSTVAANALIDCPPDVAGKLQSREIMYAGSLGVTLCIYELMDEPNLQGILGLKEASFGVYANGFTGVKVSSGYLQNLYTLLADPTDTRRVSPPAPAQVSGSVASVFMSKANGEWWIAVWQAVALMGGTGGPWLSGLNVQTPATVPATITLARAFTRAEVYQPSVSAAVQSTPTITNNTISLAAVPAELLLVRLVP